MAHYVEMKYKSNFHAKKSRQQSALTLHYE